MLASGRGRAQYAHLHTRIKDIERRLAAIEGRAGTGPDHTAINRQIASIREDKDAAVREQEYERAAQLRDTERQLLADKEARKAEWAASHPDLPTLAARFSDLSEEVGRLRGLLSQHGIDPGRTVMLDPAADQPGTRPASQLDPRPRPVNPPGHPGPSPTPEAQAD
ncbi:MAG TPA: UvrB/UvrC motif-containing protein [Streptosporangiaceae bacterium]|nr:UvrB/UvrC motif-containing protein [Streptosporangiaceae bacterium]